MTATEAENLHQSLQPGDSRTFRDLPGLAETLRNAGFRLERIEREITVEEWIASTQACCGLEPSVEIRAMKPPPELPPPV